jgi:hypothetical protein
MELPKFEFTSDVIIIDAEYMNFVAHDMRSYFAQKIGRAVGPADMQTLISCIAIDAFGTDGGEMERNVLLVYDKKSCRMEACTPSDIDGEMNDRAFRTSMGEFQLIGVGSAEMVPLGDLFQDLLSIVADSNDVKRIAVVADDNRFGRKIDEIAAKAGEKSVARFVMRQPEEGEGARQLVLAYPLMQALGIRGDELMG